MLYLAVGGLLIGAAGFTCAVWFYRNLWRWAKQCDHARITVAYKGRVKLNAPLTEWLLWCNQLDRDKDATGRVVYVFGGTQVAILKKSFVDKGKIRTAIESARPRRKTATPAKK